MLAVSGFPAYDCGAKEKAMDSKAAILSLIVALAAPGATAQTAPPARGGVTVPPDRPLLPRKGPAGEDLSGSELERYNDTYDRKKESWGDDPISQSFKNQGR
jgi:hypothetical protein